ncbi:hypothetical protein QIH80_20940 [Bradyrhizobium elkanii]|nr:hypothetical protein QIH80_20940 [Bradyrhizobium elkanii]
MTKAVKALVKAGITVGRIEIQGDKIIVIPGAPVTTMPASDDVNEWDSVR